MEKTCQYCKTVIYDNFFFCPNCGKKIKEAPLSTSIAKQIGIYALSFFLPPLGLFPSFGYLRNKEPKARVIGIIGVILTIISIILTIQLTKILLGASLEQVGTTSDQLNQLQNLGY